MGALGCKYCNWEQENSEGRFEQKISEKTPIYLTNNNDINTKENNIININDIISNGSKEKNENNFKNFNLKISKEKEKDTIDNQNLNKDNLEHDINKSDDNINNNNDIIKQ